MDKIQFIRNKIHSKESLDHKLAYWRFTDKKIVFTNGCFDLLHMGHVDYLARASSLGDVMVVGLNTDRSVAENKGPGRPVNNQESRLMVMASLFFVNAVILFDEPTPLKLIEQVQPDILVKGSEYKAEDIVGYDIVTAKGGKVRTIDFVPGYSSSAIIEKIINTSK